MTAVLLWIPALAFAAAGLLTVGLIVWALWPQRIPHHRSVEGIRQRIEDESASGADE